VTPIIAGDDLIPLRQVRRLFTRGLLWAATGGLIFAATAGVWFGSYITENRHAITDLAHRADQGDLMDARLRVSVDSLRDVIRDLRTSVQVLTVTLQEGQRK